MSSINKALRQVRPRLRIAAPLAFWASIGFGIFNILLGLGLMKTAILKTLTLVGIVPIKAWGLLFFIHGVAMLVSVYANSWTNIRTLHALGVGIKLTWWCELVSTVIVGFPPFILLIWTLLLYLQFLFYHYLFPQEKLHTGGKSD